MRCCVCLCVVLLFLWTVQAAKKETCERCETADNCPLFKNLEYEAQQNWRGKYNCEDPSKGDMVCCPENVWQISNPTEQKGSNSQDSNSSQPMKMEKNSFLFQPNYNTPNYFGYPSVPTTNNQYGNQGYPNGIYGNQYPNNPNGINTNQRYENANNRPSDQNGYQVYENNYENGANQPYNNGNNGLNSNQFGGQGTQNANNQFGNQNGNPGYDNGGNDDDGGDYDSQKSPFWSSRRHGKKPNNAQNPYFLPADRKDNSFRGTNLGGQCPVTSFPPDPDTGCCGREATDSDGITGSANNPRYPQSSWMPQANLPSPGYQPWSPYSDRVKRADVNVTFDNRIAGGKETDLEQFPWTVLLKTIFQYPTKDVAFSCGGSLISSRYILTAGHCIFDSKGTVKDVEIYLAEYDKRTFPRDCKNVLGRGEVCVENIVMHAESVHLHPEYDDNRLHNDIALIRLRGDAPYTDYIRPICLPPINVDSPQLSNLRLAVAGWGRNGQYKSNIKQSTVVNLVPNSDCRSSYPGLTRLQVCAAGYSGEDTCKGDSGGPLMMLYGGKYFVSGVVSGKRADAPCGTSVPSLYTNVFQYLPWIRGVITN